MATIHIEGDHLTIALTRFEKITGLIGDQRVALRDITEVAVESEPHQAITGMRAPGLAIPARTKIGTWRGRGRRMFVCVRTSQPAVRIEATGSARYQAYLVSVTDPVALAEQIAAVGPASRA